MRIARTAPQKKFTREILDKCCLYLRLFLGMGVIWYFEILSWYTGGNWAMFFDCINMLQVRVMHLLFWYNVYNAGSLGVHYLRVQEERAQSGHEEVEQPLQHDRQANVQ